MARIQTHIEDCERLLGKGYDHVHNWLDEYAKDYPPHILLEYHRKFRHNIKALDEQFKIWGHYEIMAAKIHIIRDVELYVLQKPMDEVEIEEIVHYRIIQFLDKQMKEDLTQHRGRAIQLSQFQGGKHKNYFEVAEWVKELKNIGKQ